MTWNSTLLLESILRLQRQCTRKAINRNRTDNKVLDLALLISPRHRCGLCGSLILEPPNAGRCDMSTCLHWSSTACVCCALGQQERDELTSSIEDFKKEQIVYSSMLCIARQGCRSCISSKPTTCARGPHIHRDNTDARVRLLGSWVEVRINLMPRVA